MGIDIDTIAREIGRLGKVPVNILKGLPIDSISYTGFDTTPPTDLGNAVDGDTTTATGDGKKTLGGSGTVGEYIFDLGANRTVLFGALVGVHSSASAITVYSAGSEDNVTWRANGAASGTATSVAEVGIDLQLHIFFDVRYLRIKATIGGAGDGYMRIYEAVAYELPL